ncbi:MAG: DNA mismatch endonuclease Vsr [Pseudodesulfovibrio sp.]|nr:DNA mismatch endonuclease Vsr [Pseudodesulfovibrio sp.]
MTDIVDKATRSRMMSSIKGKDSKPEMAVRKFLHASGLRFRLHRKDLPGKPDIILPKYKTAIFVHGCFWHRHEGCPKATTPASNMDFWEQKFAGNIERDRRNQGVLRSLGWRVLIMWECEITPGSLQALAEKIICG